MARRYRQETAAAEMAVPDLQRANAELQRQLDERTAERDEALAREAVIAMENARLLTETREALERQTATAEILRVISSSPTDVHPTFDAIAATAATLTGAAIGTLFRFDGSPIHAAADHGVTG